MIEVDEVAPVKKGRKVEWKPAKSLNFLEGPEGHRKRWVNNDEANIQKKLAEGWIPINKTTAPTKAGFNMKMANASTDGKPLGSNPVYRELVGMALSEEIGEARDEHFRKKSEDQVRGRIKGAVARKELSKYAENITTSVQVD